MNIDMTKTLNNLSLQVSDFIEVEYDVIKAVAASSNGQFVQDRNTLSVGEFLAKYFANYEVADTIEKMEARRKANIVSVAKAKKVKEKDPVLNQYGNYIVTLWECGNEFAASYRKTNHMQSQWHILTKYEIEYKMDGRRFSVVHHVGSRQEALTKKNELIAELEARGLTYKGEMPV
jgi:hypothetical protein